MKPLKLSTIIFLFLISFSNYAQRNFDKVTIETIKTNVLKDIADNKTEDEVASNISITATYDTLGYGNAFINSEKMRRTFYRSLKKR